MFLGGDGAKSEKCRVAKICMESRLGDVEPKDYCNNQTETEEKVVQMRAESGPERY